MISPHNKRSGFALVVALSLMAFVLLLLLSMSTLVQVETRSVQTSVAQLEARQAALLGLNVALGELQKAAGPDQRVTATADLLNDNTNIYTGGFSVPEGQNSWTGVWRSDIVAPTSNPDGPSYSPATPDTREFVAWLVSATDNAGQYQLPMDNLSLNRIERDISSLTFGDGSAASVALFKQVDGSPYSLVEKVNVGQVSQTATQTRFAFHVEDESVKADLSWNEIPATGGGPEAQARAQARRLSAAPGPDYGTLNLGSKNGAVGPFDSVSYPLSIDTGGQLFEDLNKMQSVKDITVSMQNAQQATEWVKDNRSNITWGSRGVLADVKWGGLRRDLSLAFEMDGVAESENAQLFNQQIGEFVGGNDRYAAPQAALGMNNITERFLYRDTTGTGSTFSSDIVSSDSVIRGPNWWALRDYANMYKRLSISGSGYVLKARSYYPNISASSNNRLYNLGTMTGANSSSYTWDSEIYRGGYNLGSDYIFRPARSNYAPVLLGYTALYSVLKNDGNQLCLGIDPFFFIWNPYNRKISVDRYAIKLSTLPGHITFWVTKPGGTVERYGPATIGNYLAQEAKLMNSTLGNAWNLSYLLSDVSLEPGEVMVVSPRSNRNNAKANVFHDEVFPGTNTNNESGAILSVMPHIVGVKTDSNGIPQSESIEWKQVPLNTGDTIEFLYTMDYQAKQSYDYVDADGITKTRDITAGTQGMSEHFMLDAHLPESNVVARDLSNNLAFGDHIQQIGGNTQGDLSVAEYYDPPRSAAYQALRAPTGSADESTLIGKRFFGVGAFLTKPANHGGDYGTNVGNFIELLSHFNPFPIGGYNDMHRPSHLSQAVSMIADPGTVDELLTRAGINFPATDGKGFWGESFEFTGSTSVPILNIPAAPLMSLVEFSNANLTIGSHQPFRSVGNSWASPFVSPVSPYGQLEGFGFHNPKRTASDMSWLMNDALFDRYYLSGIAPLFSIEGGGYFSSAGIESSLDNFFGNNYREAQANPVLVPYLPDDMPASDAVNELSANDGYRKLGAYSLVNGAFNVNSTSVAAWEALLQGNRDVAVDFVEGRGLDSNSGTPFPSSTSPVAQGNGAKQYWSGFSRLSDAQIRNLAVEIVNEVKLRGPFMSLSDFVNHRVGRPKNNATHYMGALQSAIESSGINSTARTGSGGVTLDYGNMTKYMPDLDPGYSNRLSSTGIPTDISQADLLLPLAPRLTARADTFRIRAYGEAISSLDAASRSSAICEAVVQRVPEYVDSRSDDPWDEAMNPLNPSNSALSPLNDQFGRRFKVVSIRWLNEGEI